MIEFIPFKAEHLDLIDPTEEGARHRMVDAGGMLEDQPFAMTAFRSGECLGCGGLSQIHEGRCVAWAVVSKYAPAIVITRLMRTYMKRQTVARIEAVVDADDIKCQRWISLLGFEKESGRLRKFNRDGSDVILYARVHHGA